MPKQLKGSNGQRTKELNRALILKLICTSNPISRIALSKKTQLSKMSVTNIINEFIEKQIVIESKETPKNLMSQTSVGRTPILLTVNPSAFLAIGVYIARDFCEVALIDITGFVAYKQKTLFASIESKASFMKKIIEQINATLTINQLSIKQITGIGIASIGPLDIPQGVILEPPNFHGLVTIPIVSILKKQYACPIFINNDMNASALAEKYYGIAKDHKDFIYVGITNGIGAGIIINNKLFIGHNGFSGEFGHTTIHMDGPTCVCGNKGCLEIYANIPEVIQKFNDAIELGVISSLKSTPSWPDIVAHAKKGDELCLKLLQHLASYISIGLTNLANLFDPEIFILGHDIVLASDLILPFLNKDVNKKIFSSNHVNLSIYMSKFIDSAPLIGSASLVFDALYDGRITL